MTSAPSVSCVGPRRNVDGIWHGHGGWDEQNAEQPRGPTIHSETLESSSKRNTVAVRDRTVFAAGLSAINPATAPGPWGTPACYQVDRSRKLNAEPKSLLGSNAGLKIIW